MLLAQISSRLEHGCQFFIPAPKCHLNTLNRIQPKAFRICTGANATTPISVLEVVSSKMTLHLRRSSPKNETQVQEPCSHRGC